MIWLWWGYGLWLVVVVDCGHGGGAELLVLIVIVVVVEWVATLRGFQIFFLVVGFIWFWLANGGWPPWLPLAPLWATATTAKPPYKTPSNFRSKHLTTTIGRMNNGVVFLSLVCSYFLFNLWLGSKTFFYYSLGLKNERDFWYGFLGLNYIYKCCVLVFVRKRFNSSCFWFVLCSNF